MKVSRAFSNGRPVMPFLTCGYPDLERTTDLIYALDQGGADLIVLGIPFSDPTGEGPISRKASEHALRQGVTADHVLELVARVRYRTTIPLVLRTYANVVFSYGTERFIKQAVSVGADALILPDVPFAEQEEFAGPCGELGLEYVSPVVPTSKSRLEQIAQAANGFICLIPGDSSQQVLDQVRQFTSLPIVVSCGQTRPQDVAEAIGDADGVLLEAAIMEIVDRYGASASAVATEYVSSVVESISCHSHLKNRMATALQTTVMPTKTATSNP